MKKLMIWIVSGVSAIVLSGCGGGGESTVYHTYFITSSDGFGVEGIVYSCYSGTLLLLTVTSLIFILFPMI